MTKLKTLYIYKNENSNLKNSKTGNLLNFVLNY